MQRKFWGCIGQKLVLFWKFGNIIKWSEDSEDQNWSRLSDKSHLSTNPEKAMASHSSTLTWKIPCLEEPGRLQSMGSLRVGHESDFTFTFHFHALEKETATHSSVLAWRILGGVGGWRAQWAAVYGVAQSRT